MNQMKNIKSSYSFLHQSLNVKEMRVECVLRYASFYVFRLDVFCYGFLLVQVVVHTLPSLHEYIDARLPI